LAATPGYAQVKVVAMAMAEVARVVEQVTTALVVAATVAEGLRSGDGRRR
jgi:hypothetical protein